MSFLWDEWVQIGVSGATDRVDRWAIDPEPLLVTTLRIGARDPRLFDEVLDWLRENGRLVSVQRLKNLTRGMPEERQIADAALAWAGAHSPTLHAWQRRGSGEPHGLMELGSIRIAKADPILEANGVRWPLVRPSRKSASPDLDLPSGLCFRFRNLFGLGARAEVVRFLWSSEEGGGSTARRIAEATGFAKRNVQEILSSLGELDTLVVEPRGNEYVYGLHPTGWAEVLGIPIDERWDRWPFFLDWIALGRVLSRTVSFVDHAAATEPSNYLLSSRGRDLVTDIASELRRLGIEVPRIDKGDGEAFLIALDSMLSSILKLIADEP
ncbi:MAG: hypothetical protein ACXWW9_05710 [Actinomycetota bacterium]